MKRLPQHRCRQRGFNLVELLIAMALGLFVIQGIMQVYTGNRQAYRWVAAHSQMQESLRFSLDTMMFKIRNAAYQGCGGEGSNVRNVLTDAATDYNYDFSNKIIGYVGTGSSWTPSGLPLAIRNAADPASDVITLRGVSNISAPLQTNMTSPSSAITVLDTGTLASGDIAMVTDCMNSTIFLVTGTTTSSGDLTLQHVVSTPATGPSNTQPDLYNTFGAASQVVKVVTETFYVSKKVTNASAPDTYICWASNPERSLDESTTPGLCRVEMGQPGRRIIDGVERMKIAYGLDADKDKFRSVDRYVSATVVNSSNNWANVVSVRLGLLFRSGSAIRQGNGPTSYTLAGNAETVSADKFMRRAINQTVAIRNRLQ